VEVRVWFKVYLHLLLSVDQEEETVDSVQQVVQELLIKVLLEDQTPLMIIQLQAVAEQQQQVQHLQAQVFQEQVEQE
jgi:pimeloyl-CoA synthetase